MRSSLARLAPAVARLRVEGRRSSSWQLGAGALAGSAIGAAALCESKTTLGSPVATNREVPRDQDLRIIGLEELRAHNNMDDGLWISYHGHVYDVTHFARIHPGGPGRIQMAGGSDLQKYFDVYHVHPDVSKFLDRTCLLGRLTAADAKRSYEETIFGNPYEDEPPRDLQQTIAKAPRWANLMGPYLLDSFRTPLRGFYVRNHFPVPSWEDVENDYEFEVSVPGATRSFKLKDLRALPQATVEATLICGGAALYPRYLHRTENRESWEQKEFPRHEVNNNFWGSHAVWTGVKCRDVLRLCGLDVDALALGEKPMPAKYLRLTGHDADETGASFGVTIPLEKAIDPFGDVLLATTMNGSTLPADHGYPVRVLVPGFAGVRNCKWLAKMELSDELHSSHVDTHTDEVIYPPNMNFEDHVAKASFTGQAVKRAGRWEGGQDNEVFRVMEMPVHSSVLVPELHSVVGKEAIAEVLKEGLEVKGIALGGGGHRIARVDVSIDGGKSYIPADLDDHGMEKVHKRNYHWSWYWWSKKVPLSEEMKHQLLAGQSLTLQVASRAMTEHGNTQPSRQDAVSLYNLVGNICSDRSTQIGWNCKELHLRNATVLTSHIFDKVFWLDSKKFHLKRPICGAPVWREPKARPRRLTSPKAKSKRTWPRLLGAWKMPVGGTWGPCHRAESSALDAAQTPDGLFGDSIGDPSSGICWDEAVVVECDKARVDGDEIFLGSRFVPMRALPIPSHFPVRSSEKKARLCSACGLSLGRKNPGGFAGVVSKALENRLIEAEDGTTGGTASEESLAQRFSQEELLATCGPGDVARAQADLDQLMQARRDLGVQLSEQQEQLQLVTFEMETAKASLAKDTSYAVRVAECQSQREALLQEVAVGQEKANMLDLQMRETCEALSVYKAELEAKRAAPAKPLTKSMQAWAAVTEAQEVCERQVSSALSSLQVAGESLKEEARCRGSLRWRVRELAEKLMALDEELELLQQQAGVEEEDPEIT
ncbi:Sulfite oxidase [Durusdinium trenchii]|uniref:Mitochondrial (Protein shopper) n=1 Tax=Durusdinium trenchii TaxID=1381693 RepID=A0ABP0MNA8_9DINO